jgi:hypothetical protein
MSHPLVVLAALTAVVSQQGPSRDVRRIPLDAGWELAGEGTRIETYRGTRAIRMRTGQAVRRDVSLQDGTIEFDMAVTPHRSFVYLRFRMVTDEEHEEIYFRPHKSALPDAIQYSPVWRGESNWQLYHGRGGTAPATLPRGEWIHVRLVLSGRRAALFVGDGDAPELVMPLGREPAAGHLAFSSFAPDGGAPEGEPVAAFANVVVRPGYVPHDFRPESPAGVPAGLVARWQLSPAFASEPGPVTRLPETLLASKARWPTFPVEPTGVVVIGRHVPRPARQSAVVARLLVRAPAGGLQRLQLGYSDYVTVYVNGRPLFAGDAHYSYDEPRQEGVIGLWQATVWLPLTAGDNEVLLAVSDGFGGWGLTARLDPADGARVVEPAQ